MNVASTFFNINLVPDPDNVPEHEPDEELLSVSRNSSMRRRAGTYESSSRGNSASSNGRSESRLSPNQSVKSKSGSRSPSPGGSRSSNPIRVTHKSEDTSVPCHRPKSAHVMDQLNKDMASLFDPATRPARPKPEMPSPDNVEYPRAASWSSCKLSVLLADDKGRQLFRVFLWDSLAEENLHFIEATDKLKKMMSNDEKKAFANEILRNYAQSINLSMTSMQKITESANSNDIDVNDWAPAIKEVRRLLENDQLPRFRRSDIFLEFLELILPRSYAEKWATTFEALLGNHVGRHHFRIFLKSIRAEENLRFWDAVVEFRGARGKGIPTQAKDIIATFLAEGAINEVFLPFGVKQLIDSKVAEGQFEISLFDEATKHVEQVLRNDPYVRFLQSSEYLDLLSRLTR